MNNSFNDPYHGIIKLVNGEGVICATAFFIQDEYSATCDQNVQGVGDIYVEQGKKKYRAERSDKYSSRENNIAILRVKGLHLEPLKLVKEALPALDVTIRGYLSRGSATRRKGKADERKVEIKGKLSNATKIFHFSQDGSARDIPKPRRILSLDVFTVSVTTRQILDRTLSGSPVFYSVNNTVVGMFYVTDNNAGFMIPIQNIMDLLQSKPVKMDLETLLTEGERYLSKEDYVTAITFFDKVLELDPNFVNALFNKAWAYGNLGKNEEAIKYYDKVLEIDPAADAYYNKGEILSNLKEYKAAIDSYDKALAIDPKFLDALDGKGRVISFLGMHEEAIRYYDKVLKSDPKHSRALFNKAWSYGNLGKYEEAIKYYDKVLKIEPQNARALYNKAWSYGNLGKYEEAIKYYDKVLKIDPKHVDALYNKAWSYGDLGKYEESIKYYEKVLELDPNFVKALFNKAWSYGNLGKDEEAIRYYDKVLEIDPNFFDAYYNKGEILSKLERYSEAVPIYDKALDINPNDAVLLYNKGMVLKKMGRLKEAEVYQERARKLGLIT